MPSGSFARLWRQLSSCSLSYSPPSFHVQRVNWGCDGTNKHVSATCGLGHLCLPRLLTRPELWQVQCCDVCSHISSAWLSQIHTPYHYLTLSPTDVILLFLQWFWRAFLLSRPYSGHALNGTAGWPLGQVMLLHTHAYTPNMYVCIPTVHCIVKYKHLQHWNSILVLTSMQHECTYVLSRPRPLPRMVTIRMSFHDSLLNTLSRRFFLLPCSHSRAHSSLLCGSYWAATQCLPQTWKPFSHKGTTIILL